MRILQQFLYKNKSNYSVSRILYEKAYDFVSAKSPRLAIALQFATPGTAGNIGGISFAALY